ncbi:SPX domain-containing protein [Xylogone sp. PMI_703]|nr:SPX domain-containing protein [Xylogone sp. PMI_703]
MGEPDEKQKPSGIPSWQIKATESSNPAAQEDPEPASREDVVAQARKFLEEDEVKDASPEKKAAFLETKGLQKDEIQALLGEEEKAPEIAAPPPDQTPESHDEMPISQSQTSPPPSPPQQQFRDAPPIITYPEFLTTPTSPAPLVTKASLLTTVYVFGGLSALLYGTNNYLIAPMLESLTESRLSLAETATSNLTKLISKLEGMVSEIPPTVTIGSLHKAETGEIAAGESSEEEDPTELFHRDIGVQTSMPSTPSRSHSISSSNEPSVLENQTSRLFDLSRNVRSLLDFDTAEEESAKELSTSVSMVQEYLDTIVGAARRYDFVGTAYGVSGTGRSSGEQDDEISKVKTQIIGVKGVLLSARNFPRGPSDHPSSTNASHTTRAYITDKLSLTRLQGGGRTSTQPRAPVADLEEYELVDYGRQRGSRKEEKRAEKLRNIEEADEMKFSHSIQFNAVPDWSNHYIAYSNLKKLIYQLEKTAHRPATGHDAESAPLIRTVEDPDQVFKRALDVELEKISSFYQLKELEIYGDVSEFLTDVAAYEEEVEEQAEGQEIGRPRTGSRTSERPRTGSIFRSFTSRPRRTSTISRSVDEDSDDDDDDDEDESTALQKSRTTNGKRRSVTLDASIDDLRASTTDFTKSTRRGSASYYDFAEQAFATIQSSGITLKKRAIGLYVQLCELKSFVQLNKTGFSKVLKKYDKILDRNIKSKCLNNVVYPSSPFVPETMKHLDENIARMEQAYADIVTQGDVVAAKKELRMYLREHVVWERNTVWREMIGIERKAQAANMGLRRTLLGPDNDPASARLQGDDDVVPEMKDIVTPIGRFSYPTWLFSSTMLTLVVIIGIFFALLYIPIMDKVEQQNCLAMLVFVSLLWATEVIPLFVTSLMIPFLSVILRVVRDDDRHVRLDAAAATKYIFAAMWTPVIMLLLGGFTIAAALSKYDIAKRIATFVLSKAGTKPRTVLVTNMLVAAFASMWISNVAAPVLCFSIIQPMLRNLPADSQMSKALILGIALASNIGGMLSPIASPQNIVALQIMTPTPTWGAWFFVVIPVGLISIVLIWITLLVSFRPGRGTTIVPIRPVKDKFTGVQWFISLVTLATIVLWCVTHQLEWLFGEMGIVAIIPMVLFFGTGILTKEDFNNFLWTIIILAAGGLSLGKAVNSSGLLHTIATAITKEVAGMSLYGILVVFSLLILVVATFISHTVAALIILPLVYSVGIDMDDPRPNLLVMGGALMCSAAMGLPTSGFPNMTAIMMEDPHTGQRYLQVTHFISRGIPSSVITLGVIITVGYGLMLVVGLD